MANLLDWICIASVSTNAQVGLAIQLNKLLEPPLPMPTFLATLEALCNVGYQDSQTLAQALTPWDPIHR